MRTHDPIWFTNLNRGLVEYARLRRTFIFLKNNFILYNVMPRYYKKRRKTRRSIRKRYKIPRSVKMAPYTQSLKYFRGTGMPDVLHLKMPYATQYSLVSDTGTKTTQTFSLNSINDPDETGIGGQVMLHDQMATLYQSYQVKGVRFQCWCTSTTANPACITFRASNDSASTSSYIQDVESSKCATRIVSSSSGGGSTIYFDKYYNIASLYGDRRLDNNDSQAAFNADPIDQAFMHVSFQSIDQAATSAAECVFKLTYYVRCHSLLLVARS